MNVRINYRLERNENIICETKSLYVLVALLIAVSVYCYMIQYKVKRKTLYVTNNKFKTFCINNVLIIYYKIGE